MAFSGGLSRGFMVGRGLQEMKVEEAARERQKMIDDERRSIIENSTTDIVKERDEDGNLVSSRVPKPMNLEDQLAMYEKLGAHEMKYGKMDAEKSMRFGQQMRALKDEGVWDAYEAFRSTGDISEAIKMFNRNGKVKLDPQAGVHESEKVDPVSGMPYKTYKVRAEDGRVLTFDPLEVARASGGAKGILEQQKAFQEGRKTVALERRADYEGLRADASQRTADAAMVRAMREPSGRGSENAGGVFGFKMNWLKQNMPNLSADQQYALATGQRRVPAAQIKKWAEDAVARQEKLSGVPFKSDVRARLIQERVDFLKDSSDEGDGLSPGAPRPNAAPRSGGKDYSGLWGN